MTEFNDLLKEIGLTRREFADMIGITYASMNVMLSTGNTPKWVTSALIVARRLRSNEA
jgi:predicted transcriptional regulator